MADADDIRDALAIDAAAGIQKTTVGNESVDLMKVDDRKKAADIAAGEVAVTQPHLGALFRQIIPPSCG